jgi:uncharacterized protein YbjT (DUF2867 family)
VTSGPVLVFGATGTQGGAVARELLARAVPVQALVRDPHSERAQALANSGAQLVPGDLRDERSLARAMSGAPVAYAITTPFEDGADAEVRQGEAIIRAAVEARLPWLIFASVAAAGRAEVPHFQSKARIEARLRDASVPWTVVAPSYFYENVTGSRAAIVQGLLPLPMPVDKPLHQVGLRVLGAVVAAILDRREEHLSERVEIAADAPTPTGMATALGARAVETPLAELRERSPDLAALYAFLAADGYGIDVRVVRARYPEVAWIGFAEWAAALEWDDDRAGHAR